MPGIFPNDGEVIALAGVIGVGGFNPKVHLYRNNLDQDPDTTLGDLVEANFEGYLAKTGPFPFLPTTGPSGEAGTLGQVLTWTMTGGGNPQEVYGWYATLENGMGERILLCYQKFPEAVPFHQAGDYLTGRIVLTLTSV